MTNFSSFQQQRRGQSATPTPSFMRPVRPFAPLLSPSSQTAHQDGRASLDHAASFEHSFANIPLFPTVQRKTFSPSPLQKENQLSSRIQAARSSGHPLNEQAQQRLEQGTGMDLSAVRVHTDTEADRLSRAVNAVAFTTGSDIFFRSGSYNPYSPRGFHTLAHEVTHVVQQATGPVSGIHTLGSVSISDQSDRFEQAAEANASRLAALANEKDATPRLKQLVPIHSSAASQLLALQRLVFLASDHLDVDVFYRYNDIMSIVKGTNMFNSIDDLESMLALNAHIDWALKKDKHHGPLQDVNTLDLRILIENDVNELFYIVEHGNVGKIGSMTNGVDLGQKLINGKLPQDFKGTIMITSCFAGATDATHPESLVKQLANKLQMEGRQGITIKGAIGTTITTHGAGLGALSTGFQVVKNSAQADAVKTAMMQELSVALKKNPPQGPQWWPTALADIQNLENAKPAELAAAKQRAVTNGTTEEIEFVIGFAEKSSEMFRKIQQKYLEKLAVYAHLYTPQEEVQNNVITTVKT